MPEGIGYPPAAPPLPKPGNPVPAGPTAPAVTAPQNAGLTARVPMLVESAMKPLMEALKFADPLTEDGQDIMKAIQLLSKRFGKPSPDMTRADLKLQGERAGGANPANPMAWQNMMQQSKNSMGQPAPALPPQTPAMAGA